MTVQSLVGETVVICRAARDAGPLVDELEKLGAAVLSVPLVEPVAPPDDGRALRSALAELDTFDWIVTTSANGSRAVLAALNQRSGAGRGARWPSGVQVACVGTATARVFTEVGIPVAVQASVSSARGLVDGFPPSGSRPDDESTPRVLAPLGVLASDLLADGLVAKGYDVVRVDAYHTEAAEITDETRRRVSGATSVLFTSSSTVERFVQLLGADRVPSVAVSIGPKTTDTMRALNVEPTAQAENHTQQGVIEALVDVVSTMER